MVVVTARILWKHVARFDISLDLPTHRPIHPSTHASIHTSIRRAMHLSMSRYLDLAIDLPIHLPIDLSVNHFIGLCADVTIYLPVCVLTHRYLEDASFERSVDRLIGRCCLSFYLSLGRWIYRYIMFSVYQSRCTLPCNVYRYTYPLICLWFGRPTGNHPASAETR